MGGLSDAREKAILDSEFSSSVYLRLLTGAAGQEMNDNGTFPAGLSEVTGGGYAPRLISSASWASAVAGNPSIKTMPNPAHSPITFTPSGASWDICGFAFTSDNSTISSSNLLYSGVLVDVVNAPTLYHVGDGTPFSITDQYPIVVRLGDPPAGVNPT